MTDPRQLDYEADRRLYSEIHPPVEVRPKPPILHLTPPADCCPRCDGKRIIRIDTALAEVFWTTCPACGGSGWGRV